MNLLDLIKTESNNALSFKSHIYENPQEQGCLN
jgi:hypothetical protein